MKAFGEHILIRKPTKKTELESGIMLPDSSAGVYSYGLVLSAGPQSGCNDGEFVLYDDLGTREIAIDPMRDDGLVVAHQTHIFAHLTEQDLIDRKLPIPKA